MIAEPMITSQPRRRWLQFSLRTMMVLMLVFAYGLGWLAHEVQRARVQREAAGAIQKLGGRVEHQSGDISRAAVLWLGRVLGEPLPGDVTAVSFFGTQVADAGLVHLPGLTQLQTLDLRETAITDVGLAQLGGLRQLDMLELNNTQVTDIGLAQLWGLSELAVLDLSGTNVTDAGLVFVKGMTQLCVLDLSDTQVTDAGLVHLRTVRKLCILHVNNTAVTNVGVNELKKELPNCEIDNGPLRHKPTRIETQDPDITRDSQASRWRATWPTVANSRHMTPIPDFRICLCEDFASLLERAMRRSVPRCGGRII